MRQVQVYPLQSWQALLLALTLLLAGGCERFASPGELTLTVHAPLARFAQELALAEPLRAALYVRRAGLPLPAGAPLPLSAERESAQLSLPPGRYDLVVSVTDTSGNELGLGSMTVQLEQDSQVSLPLFTRVGGVDIIAPEGSDPNTVFDVYARVYPPGRPDLRVPESDYTLRWEVVETDALLLLQSVTTAKVKAKCETVTTQATVTEVGTGKVSTAKKPTPVVQLCPVTPGADLVPPIVRVASPLEASAHPIGRRLTVEGTARDEQTGVARVDVYDGVTFLGVASLGGGKGEQKWKFTFTPSEARSYRLTALALDAGGNEGIARVTVAVR